MSKPANYSQESWDGSVGMTWLWTESKTRGPVPGRRKTPLSSVQCSEQLCGAPTSHSIGTGGSIPGGKSAEALSCPHLHVESRLTRVELYLHSPRCVPGVLLKLNFNFFVTIQSYGNTWATQRSHTEVQPYSQTTNIPRTRNWASVPNRLINETMNAYWGHGKTSHGWLGWRRSPPPHTAYCCNSTRSRQPAQSTCR
jgi:hypothetical protein